MIKQNRHQLIDMGKMSSVQFIKTKQSSAGKFIARYKGCEVHIVVLGSLSDKWTEKSKASIYDNLTYEWLVDVDRHAKILDVYKIRSNVYLPE